MFVIQSMTGEERKRSTKARTREIPEEECSVDLYIRKWPADSPKALVAFVHGAAEHSGRYERTAQRFNQEHLYVLACDLPGHGRSPGRRGHIHSFEDYLQAVDTLVEEMKHVDETLPRFILGHSMGGLIAIRYAQTRRPDVNGVMVSSPLLSLSLPVSPLAAKLARVMSRIWPTFSQSNRIAPQNVSRSADVVASYASDALLVRKVSARWFTEISQAMDDAAKAPRLNVPNLILQAGSDLLVNPQATRAFAQVNEGGANRFVEYPNLYHELLNEPEQEQVVQEVLNWLSGRLNANA